MPAGTACFVVDGVRATKRAPTVDKNSHVECPLCSASVLLTQMRAHMLSQDISILIMGAFRSVTMRVDFVEGTNVQQQWPSPKVVVGPSNQTANTNTPSATGQQLERSRRVPTFWSTALTVTLDHANSLFGSTTPSATSEPYTQISFPMVLTRLSSWISRSRIGRRRKWI